MCRVPTRHDVGGTVGGEGMRDYLRKWIKYVKQFQSALSLIREMYLQCDTSLVRGVHWRFRGGTECWLHWLFLGGRLALCDPGQKLLSVHCCLAPHRISIRRMRCSVVSIAWSQRVINPLISRWAVRNTPLSTCSSNPMSSRSSMVSSNWYCNLMAKSLTRWTKRSCWSKARTWSAVSSVRQLGSSFYLAPVLVDHAQARAFHHDLALTIMHLNYLAGLLPFFEPFG